MSTEQSYSFLSEVWGEEPPGIRPIETSCVLQSKANMKDPQLDNIMDAYIGNASVQMEEPTMQCKNAYDNNESDKVDRVNITKCSFGVDGYNLASLGNYAALDSYYGDAIKSSKQPVPKLPTSSQLQIYEESIPDRDQIYKNIVEKYNDGINTGNNNRSSDSKYLELVLYLLSGIFLIFMMEQILQIGKQLR